MWAVRRRVRRRFLTVFRVRTTQPGESGQRRVAACLGKRDGALGSFRSLRKKGCPLLAQEQQSGTYPISATAFTQSLSSCRPGNATTHLFFCDFKQKVYPFYLFTFIGLISFLPDYPDVRGSTDSPGPKSREPPPTPTLFHFQFLAAVGHFFARSAFSLVDMTCAPLLYTLAAHSYLNLQNTCNIFP